jgi:hypothetical protein
LDSPVFPNDGGNVTAADTVLLSLVGMAILTALALARLLAAPMPAPRRWTCERCHEPLTNRDLLLCSRCEQELRDLSANDP